MGGVGVEGALVVVVVGPPGGETHSWVDFFAVAASVAAAAASAVAAAAASVAAAAFPALKATARARERALLAGPR